MERRIVLRLKGCAVLVCGWRASFSSVFRGVCTIPPQVFCLRAIAARILVNDRLLLEQVAVEMQAFLDVSRGCFMGSGMQDQKGLVPALARTVLKSCV